MSNLLIKKAHTDGVVFYSYPVRFMRYTGNYGNFKEKGTSFGHSMTRADSFFKKK